MNTILENNFLRVEIDKLGAEIKSIKNKLSLLYVFSSYLFGILLFLLGYLFTKTVVFN